jgi:alkaline phosphatase D
MSSFSLAGLRSVRSVKPNTWLTATLTALVVSISFLTADPAVAKVLTHGPVVGGVTDLAGNVFLRTDQATTVAVQYSTHPDFATFSVSDSRTTDATNDFTANVPLTNLSAETTYYMRVLVNGVLQSSAPPYPSFKTFAPIGTSRSFSFVVLADFFTVTNLDRDVATFQHASERNPAFAFVGGDFDHRNPTTLDQKRAMFKSLYDPNTLHMSGFVPLILQKMPIIHQWDDHDSGSNNCDRTYLNWNLSQQAFQEYVPTYPLPGVTPGIWQKFSYAQVEFFVLDCRSQRDPDNDVDDSNKSMLDGNDLGANGQLQWLKDGLLASTAKWKVIFTSVVTNTATKALEGWAGYQTEWNNLRDFINTNKIQGILFISGDLHLGAIDNGVNSGFPEMCVAAPNSTRVPFDCPTSGEGSWGEGDFQDPCSGFGVVTVEQNPDRLFLEAVDEFGVTRVSYTVPDPNSTPTPTPTVSPTPTPTPTPSPPLIERQPNDATVAVGRRARFKVHATGSLPLLYQWKKNGVDIGGATGAQYQTPPTTLEDDQSLFKVVVSNSGGTITSTEAKLRVHP